MGGSSSSQKDLIPHQQVERPFQQIHQHKEQEKSRYHERIQEHNRESEIFEKDLIPHQQVERPFQQIHQHKEQEKSRYHERIQEHNRETERLGAQEQIRSENEALNIKPVGVRDTLFNLWLDPHFNRYLAVRYIQLSNSDSKYQQIYKKISNKQNFIIDRIDKIENPLLERSYELRKIQKKEQFPQCQEHLLFHGIKADDVDNICTFNFDWRSVDKNSLISFGKGISFSSNSKYASDNCSDECYNKVMLLVKVLIGQFCPGNRHMEIPADEFDTSMKSTRKKPECDDIVTVKYDDGDFYPAYKIHYHLLKDNANEHNSKSKNDQSILNV